jgi:hypothetical protein
MDPAPRSFEELPQDPELFVPVPFACGTDVGFGDRPEGAAPSARALDKRRVTQCALSRVCGVCGAGLGRPLALVGTPREIVRNAFHFPASHVACLEELVAAYAGLDEPLLGLDTPPAEWQVVTTSGFEFVRANREDEDRRPTFQPNSLLPTG